VRIIAGDWRGRRLLAPPGRGTRPTGERTREALFNILAHSPFGPDLEGARVIDLFAGSGALGLEALSRGAAFCLFVETDEEARGAIRRNIESLDVFGRTRLHRRDATNLGPRPASAGAKFDLAFLDPPYGKGLAETALAALRDGGWLEADALAVVERGADEGPFNLDGSEMLDERVWGAAKVSFLRVR